MSMVVDTPLIFKKQSLVTIKESNQFSLIDFFILTGVVALICLLYLTNQSLWIDEGTTAWLASHPTFQGLINTQIHFSGSEAQMPFYVWYVWGWSKIFGTSEISLRMANIPFIFLFLATMLWACNILFKNRRAWILSAVSPFICFYANEARPYLEVIALSSLATICFITYLIKRDISRRLMPWICLLAVFLASGMCMLSVFLIPVFLSTLFIAYKINRDLLKTFLKDWFWPILVLLPFFVVLGGWFAWTLLKGYGGARGSPGPLNLLFAVYEFLGFLGLGPPRNLIRSAPTWHTFSQISYIVPIFIGIAVWLVLLISIIKEVLRNGINIYVELMIWMIGVGISLFFLTALLFHFQFWGRHLAQFFPIFLLIIMGLGENGSQNYFDSNLYRFALYALIIIWSFSSMRLAFFTDYKKDDYRSAVYSAAVAAGSGGTILWAASPICGSYYGLYYTNGLMPKVYWATTFPAIQTINWGEGQIEHAFKTDPHPIVIAISKPDLFDQSNSLHEAMMRQQVQKIATPNAFRIYKIP